MIGILITDENSDGHEFNGCYFSEIGDWAKTHCVSYRSYQVVDVSDTSTRWDEIAEYYFLDDKDATLFTLRWK